MLESTKAEQLSGWLGVPVTEQQVSQYKGGGGEEPVMGQETIYQEVGGDGAGTHGCTKMSIPHTHTRGHVHDAAGSIPHTHVHCAGGSLPLPDAAVGAGVWRPPRPRLGKRQRARSK